MLELQWREFPLVFFFFFNFCECQLLLRVLNHVQTNFQLSQTSEISLLRRIYANIYVIYMQISCVGIFGNLHIFPGLFLFIQKINDINTQRHTHRLALHRINIIVVGNRYGRNCLCLAVCIRNRLCIQILTCLYI